MLGQVRSSIAAPAKPRYFVVAFLIYAFTWIIVSYGLNLLGHRFRWSLWKDPFSMKHAIATGALWSVGMVAWNYWRLRGDRFRNAS